MNRIPPLLLVCTAVLAACGQQPGSDAVLDAARYTPAGNGKDACVSDRLSGLTWEVKSGQPGLHHWRNTYSWYAPDESFDGELDYRGTPDGGVCQGSACDTQAFVDAVNREKYCGFDDWRLASRDELASISDISKMKNPPTIDTNAFPFAQSGEYWSSNDYSFQYNSAWTWSFQFGHDRVEWKSTPRMARLVRGEANQLDRVKD